MFRIIALALAFALMGCADDGPVPELTTAEAVADIRERAPALSDNSDDRLTGLMRMACAMMDESGNINVFADLSVSENLNPFDVGVVAGNAIRSLCPEYLDELEAHLQN